MSNNRELIKYMELFSCNKMLFKHKKQFSNI